jgi:hypothetical protein
VIFNQVHPRRVLTAYAEYSITFGHLALAMDTP